MSNVRKRILTDEGMQPVAVQIEYADWLEIERILNSNGCTAAPPSAHPENAERYPLRGSVLRYDRPHDPATPDSDWKALD